MVPMAQSAPRTGATRTLPWIARIHSHTYYINTVTTAFVRNASSAIAEFGIFFLIFLKVPEGRGSKPECPEKTPDSLPANRCHIIIKGENQRPGWKSNHHPPTSVIRSSDQERAHWAPLLLSFVCLLACKKCMFCMVFNLCKIWFSVKSPELTVCEVDGAMGL